MARISFVADIHIGNPSAFGGQVHSGINQRGRQVLDVLERAVDAVQGHDALVICGDLFDTSSPSPQLISEVQRILSQAPKTVILMGNHDMVSDAAGDHALGPLQPMDQVLVHANAETDRISHDAVLISIPFQVGNCREWFPQTVAAAASAKVPPGTKKVLAFHLGVIDSTTPAFLAKAHDAIELETVQELMQKYDIAYAFCGNWHTPRKWVSLSTSIVQCGALCPTGWDNPGWDYGRVWTIDTLTGLLSYQMIAGPRFLSATNSIDAEAEKAKADAIGHSLYLTLKGEAAYDPQLLDEVRGWGVQARAVIDTSEAKAATRAAAVAVKGSATLNDALARYIGEMPLAAGLEREKVQALAKRYLTAGGGK